MEKDVIVSGPDRNFEGLGVLVNIPDQDDGRPVFIHGPLPYPFLVNRSPEPDRFDLIRAVVNFQVTQDSENGPVRYEFQPAMRVELKLTEYDFGHLEGEQELRLAYWDETKSKWVPFPPGENCEQSEENCAQIDRDALLATVWIRDWSDAAMAVGR